ncbi:MAG TPA: ABC transporter permease [Caldimonas sp.]|jgi:peptide/nickel transport system permease protein|nr:ABC transporter permease [Caldimonas sp.]HEX2541859.1 ABC transporter permease [Caldimonas sp.]
MPKLVFLWTDVVLYAMLALLALYAWRVRTHKNLRANWIKVARDPAALGASIVLLVFALITALDSVHFRRALPNAVGSAAGAAQSYSPVTESILDVLLAKQIATRETGYSRPLDWLGFSKVPMVRDGQAVRDFPRLQYGGAHLADPERQWRGDIARRVALGVGAGLVVLVAAFLLVGLAMRREHGGWGAALRDIAADRSTLPLRAALLTFGGICVLAGPLVVLAQGYHVFGTDRTGNDVLYQLLKSVRTAFVIGTIATIATLPFAIVLGVLAGYFKGWVDEVIQYLYTTLSSVPNVLLIAACVLMVQVYLDKNAELFETGSERSDLKIFLLCVILGLTGWATLCRLIRGETMKLRELEFVQAADAFGVSHARIMARHIVPNVMHLVLITTVLSFSELILYEAVLTYVGVGVDPSMNSFGGMINLARSQMSGDPVVWWSFVSAFAFMVALVLAANLFADGVRDAFDPRARSFRPRFRRAAMS